MEKTFSALNPFNDVNGKTKFCITCGNKATKEALYLVGDGAILVEKYCDACAEKEIK
jgi:hypothetical protein